MVWCQEKGWQESFIGTHLQIKKKLKERDNWIGPMQQQQAAVDCKRIEKTVRNPERVVLLIAKSRLKKNWWQWARRGTSRRMGADLKN